MRRGFTLIELLVAIAVDMELDRIVNFPASYHNGSGAVTFADSHAEIHR